MTNINAVVAIYKSHAEAETGVKELQLSGFDMKKLSIVGRDHHMNELITYYGTGDHVKHWGKLEVSWGWIGGLLFGSGLFFDSRRGSIVRRRAARWRDRGSTGRRSSCRRIGGAGCWTL
jgi:hypothetical protein